MNNINTVESFFRAYDNLNYEAMNACYRSDIVYSDPLFGMLEGQQVFDKVEMICKNVRDFNLTVENIEEVDPEYITCKWKADYFSMNSRRHIVFHSKAFMKLKDGIITEHSEGFSLTKWIAQAYGWKGKFFGWLSFMKRKAQSEHQGRLQRFSKSKMFFPSGKKRRHISDSFDQ